MKEKSWTNMCSRLIRNCTNRTCGCYDSYLIWSKDEPKLDFEAWKALVEVEYNQT